MKEEERQKIKDTWMERQFRKEQALGELRRDAWEKASKAASMLKANWSVSSVYLYGSLAEGRFDFLSDIDLFVTGFPPDRDYWRMLADAMELASPFPISIVLEEDAWPSLRDKVLKEGVQL